MAAPPSSTGAAARRRLPEDVAQETLERYRGSRCRSVIFDALESIEMPESRRKNVLRPGDPSPLGMCLGLTECYGAVPIPVVSAATRKRPVLASLLCEFARSEIPGFEFTSVQVNKDYAAALHVDKNDAGTSMIIGLGPFAGGELWLDDGSEAGRALDLAGVWRRFDGRRPHEVLPFAGRRYTLVYFTREPRGEAGVTPASAIGQRLVELGFPLPAAYPKQPKPVPTAEVLEVARRRCSRFKRRAQEAGGPRRVRLRVRTAAGAVLRVAVHPEAPLGHVVDLLQASGQLGGHAAALRLGALRLLPWDTAGGLGLRADDVLEAAV